MHSGIPGRSRSSLGRRGLPQVAAGGKEVPQGRGATLPMWKWPTKPGQTCLSSLWVEQGTCMCAHDQLDSSARLPCAQTTHVNGSYETTHQLGSRTFRRPQQASPHTCARESCIRSPILSTIPMASQVRWLVSLREASQEDQVGRQRHHHVQSCLKQTRDARRGLWASGEDQLCEDLAH